MLPLSRSLVSGWKKFFVSFWKTFETRFRCILDSLSRHKDLIESEKSTVTLIEAQRARELAEDLQDIEKKKHLAVVLEKLEAPDYQLDQYTATEERKMSKSGDWISHNATFSQWADPYTQCNPVLYLSGIPGAGTNPCLISQSTALFSDLSLENRKNDLGFADH